MPITTYSQFRQKLKSYLDQVVSEHSPLYVTRANGEEVVVISKSDFESMNETFFLLKSPRNAERLQKGLEEFKRGEGNEKKLIE